MNIDDYYSNPDEKPLDVIKPCGGFFSIFRTVAVIGDSLSSGEMESLNEKNEKGYHDYYEYSWGQFMARAAGNTVYNFSRGGMTASEYTDSFAEEQGFWDKDKAAQAYIIALGVNDIINRGDKLGSADDIDLDNPDYKPETFAGYYGKIILRYREIAPKSRIFLMSMTDGEWIKSDLAKAHAELLYDIAEKFDFVYVLDFFKYAPRHDKKFMENFYLGGHLNASGYLITAQQTMSYIDWIIRNNPDDFSQVAFIGKGGVHNSGAKW